MITEFNLKPNICLMSTISLEIASLKYEFQFFTVSFTKVITKSLSSTEMVEESELAFSIPWINGCVLK